MTGSRLGLGAMLVIALTLAGPQVVFAQETKKTEAPSAAGEQPVTPGLQQIEQMGPAMSSMMEMMWGGMLEFLARPETVKRLAGFTRNYYKALIDEGFSEEQAMRIVTSGGIPWMGR
jgi:hypothetical protein